MTELDQLAVVAGATTGDFAPFDPKASIPLATDLSGGPGYSRILADAAQSLHARLRQDKELCTAIGQPVVVHGKTRGDVRDLSRIKRDQIIPAMKALLHSLAHVASAPAIQSNGSIRRQSCVAIPLDRGAFGKGQVYDDLSHSAFRGLVLALVQVGWLQMVPAHYDASSGRRSRTRVRPTTPFLDWMVLHGLVFPYHPKGIQKAKAQAEGELLQVSRRRADGRKVKQILARPLNTDEQILPDLNKALMKQRLSCPMTSYSQYEALCDFKEGRPRFLLGGQKNVYRVFSEEDGRAGRLYGHWVQGLPKEYRRQLTINGKPTAELDYGGMQMALLYARQGKPMPDTEDLYAVPGYRRDDMKAVLVRSVGTATRSKALSALRQMLREAGGFRKGRDVELYDAFWGFHGGMSPHQGGNEAAWAELQAVDSRLALCVLGSLLDQGVTAIPIHDSFVVEERHADLTGEVMKREFTSMFPGASVTVKAC
ncbi:hypothetical protein [Leisingera aquaemixtae]|uniref:Uncharacterized protein n=1 Tax=Leisingera aquaemixtae TaxID=1396826 RepID=A0A0P1HWW2_9RHOB|nr:hypothetical protein [Leisingera aquaemixtae]CUH99724.1 hypothetical protein PHA8399_01849 [Leisingera aquaemixtae]